MSIFSKKSLMQLFLRIGVIASAVAVPATGSLQAKVVQVTLDQNKNGTKLPDLSRMHAQDKMVVSGKKKAVDKKSQRKRVPDGNPHAFPESTNLSDCKSCKQVNIIKTLPYLISQSGIYRLSKDFDLTSDSAAAAFVVKANNVTIDFEGHTVKLNSGMTGIYAQGISNLSVKDGTISTPVSSSDFYSKALFLNGVTSTSFRNMTCLNTLDGAFLTDCVDQHFVKCKFDGHGSNGIVIPYVGFQTVTVKDCEFGPSIVNAGINFNRSGQGVTVQNCRFFNPNVAIYFNPFFDGVSNVEISDCAFASNSVSVMLGDYSTAYNGTVVNTKIRNCAFTDIDGSAILAKDYAGLLVENCEFQAASTNNGNLLQLSSNSSGSQAADAIVRNCTFSNHQAAPEFDAVFIASAQGALFENCVFDSNPAGDVGYPSPANVHIHGSDPFGDPTSSNIRLVNCIVRNQAAYGIHCDGQFYGVSPLAVEIDNCLIDGALYAGVFLNNATTTLIKNCEVTDTANGPGISVANGSQYNAMLSNTVVNNEGQGIFIDAMSSYNSMFGNVLSYNVSDGLFISSNKNVVRENTISENNGKGINNTGGAGNEIYSNSACNNGGTDCVGIFPNTLITHPGQPEVSGGNVCCTP